MSEPDGTDFGGNTHVAPGYQRVVLKLSGEAFAGDGTLGVDPDVVASLATQIAEVVAEGVQVAIVIGEAHLASVAQGQSPAVTERRGAGEAAREQIGYGTHVDLRAEFR